MIMAVPFLTEPLFLSSRFNWDRALAFAFPLSRRSHPHWPQDIPPIFRRFADGIEVTFGGDRENSVQIGQNAEDNWHKVATASTISGGIVTLQICSRQKVNETRSLARIKEAHEVEQDWPSFNGLGSLRSDGAG